MTNDTIRGFIRADYSAGRTVASLRFEYRLADILDALRDRLPSDEFRALAEEAAPAECCDDPDGCECGWTEEDWWGLGS